MRPVPRRLLVTAVAFATLVTGAGPAAASRIDQAATERQLTPEEMVVAFDEAILTNLAPGAEPPSISGDPAIDQRIRGIAVMRGYQRRAEPVGGLVATDGFFLQPEAATAWERLQASAAAAGHSLTMTSGYRSATSQRSILLDRITGTTDAAIDTLLQTVAPPGYSKHHTGYAVDVRSGPAVLEAFAGTAVYAWLSADNWAVAKAHGWLPSYPAGVEGLGPDPEPWEFVWLGTTNIVCAGFEPTAEQPFCDTVGSVFADDIVWLHEMELTTGCTAIWFCADDNVTRGEAATFLWRLFGRVDSTFETGFEDVEDDAFYETPVRWMVENEITTGTAPSTFAPTDDLTRAQFVTFLWRAAGRPQSATGHDFIDVDGGFADAAIAWAVDAGITTGTAPLVFSPDEPATRGQIAAFLRRFGDLDLS